MEMTDSFTHMLPLTVVAITAFVVADMLKSPPVYDALLENIIEKEYPEDIKESSKKIMIEIIVQYGSRFENLQVKNINWPGKSLLVGVKRGEQNILPKGDTKIKVGDYLTILTDINSEVRIKEILNEMNEQSLNNLR